MENKFPLKGHDYTREDSRIICELISMILGANNQSPHEYTRIEEVIIEK